MEEKKGKDLEPGDLVFKGQWRVVSKAEPGEEHLSVSLVGISKKNKDQVLITNFQCVGEYPVGAE